jgi:hypothetical protein
LVGAFFLRARSENPRKNDGGFIRRCFHVLASRTGMSAAAGTLPQLRAATDPSARGGDFYGPLFVNNGSPVRRTIMRRIGIQRAIDGLWTVSERETEITLDVDAARRPGS